MLKKGKQWLGWADKVSATQDRENETDRSKFDKKNKKMREIWGKLTK